MRSVGTGSTYYRIPAESTFVGSMHFLCNLLKCSCGSVVEHCVSSAKGCGFDSQEKHILMKKCIAWMHCKSLWIKASAKCINVKPRTVHFRQEEPASPAFIVRNRPIRLDMTLWQSVYCFVYSVVHRCPVFYLNLPTQFWPRQLSGTRCHWPLTSWPVTQRPRRKSVSADDLNCPWGTSSFRIPHVNNTRK